MSIRYENILAGLDVAFKTVPSIREAIYLDYEPKAIQDTPLVYSTLSSYRREQNGGVVMEWFETQHRVCFGRPDPKAGEASLREVVNEIPRAVERDPYLGGVLSAGGYAAIGGATTGYLTLNGVTYRALEVTSVVVVRRPSEAHSG